MGARLRQLERLLRQHGQRSTDDLLELQAQAQHTLQRWNDLAGTNFLLAAISRYLGICHGMHSETRMDAVQAWKLRGRLWEIHLGQLCHSCHAA